MQGIFGGNLKCIADKAVASPQTRCIGVTWELDKHAESQAGLLSQDLQS